mmetsp:Transcript_61390/g.163286  ORF Transcript_61390/g.163286 Transcript_61390/m.163286 type:complete len:224 (-) Transcript_61390:916-1587(-)
MQEILTIGIATLQMAARGGSQDLLEDVHEARYVKRNGASEVQKGVAALVPLVDHDPTQRVRRKVSEQQQSYLDFLLRQSFPEHCVALVVQSPARHEFTVSNDLVNGLHIACGHCSPKIVGSSQVHHRPSTLSGGHLREELAQFLQCLRQCWRNTQDLQFPTCVRALEKSLQPTYHRVGWLQADLGACLIQQCHDHWSCSPSSPVQAEVDGDGARTQSTELTPG